MKMTNYEFDLAIKALEQIVLPEAIRRLGIEYKQSLIAPNTYKAMRAHRDNGGYFLIYSGDCDNTIYTHERFNIMFRAWHDFTHYHYNLNFKPENEVRTALIQCDYAKSILETFCLSERLIDCVVSVLKADIIGQVHYYTANGQFVTNQRQFVTDLIVE